MVWGWIIAMFFVECVALSMAELCSSSKLYIINLSSQSMLVLSQISCVLTLVFNF